MNYSYNHRIMRQWHYPHPRLIDVNKSWTLLRSQGYAPTWITVHYWCQKNDVYGHCSCGNNQWQGRWFPPLWMSARFEQCEIDGTNWWWTVSAEWNWSRKRPITSRWWRMLDEITLLAAVCWLLLYTMTKARNRLQELVYTRLNSNDRS